VPITGRQRGSAPDVLHEDLAIECKTRRILPGWLITAMDQAEASQQGDQLPLCVVHKDHQPYGEALAIVRLDEFRARFMENGRLKQPTTAHQRAVSH
jgi:hypothetical protein